MLTAVRATGWARSVPLPPVRSLQLGVAAALAAHGGAASCSACELPGGAAGPFSFKLSADADGVQAIGAIAHCCRDDWGVTV